MVNANNKDIKPITLATLKKLARKSLPPHVFEEDADGIEKIWLFYESVTASFILVRRIYIMRHVKGKKRKVRQFNHIIFDDFSLLNSTEKQISKIFESALHKIEEGGCWNFLALNHPHFDFSSITDCNRIHN